MTIRKIIVKEGDKVIYEGPEKQPYRENWGLPFGFRPGDLLNLVMVIGACAVFIYKTDDRIKALEVSVGYFSSFAEASDGFHSTVTGTQFKGGKPINDNFDTLQIKKTIQPESKEILK